MPQQQRFVVTDVFSSMDNVHLSRARPADSRLEFALIKLRAGRKEPDSCVFVKMLWLETVRCSVRSLLLLHTACSAMEAVAISIDVRHKGSVVFKPRSNLGVPLYPTGDATLWRDSPASPRPWRRCPWRLPEIQEGSERPSKDEKGCEVCCIYRLSETW